MLSCVQIGCDLKRSQSGSYDLICSALPAAFGVVDHIYFDSNREMLWAIRLKINWWILIWASAASETCSRIVPYGTGDVVIKGDTWRFTNSPICCCSLAILLDVNYSYKSNRREVGHTKNYLLIVRHVALPSLWMWVIGLCLRCLPPHEVYSEAQRE